MLHTFSFHIHTMPELPEVETTRAGIAPHISGKAFAQVHIRQPKLRWPVNPDLAAVLSGQTVAAVSRRAMCCSCCSDNRPHDAVTS